MKAVQLSPVHEKMSESEEAQPLDDLDGCWAGCQDAGEGGKIMLRRDDEGPRTAEAPGVADDQHPSVLWKRLQLAVEALRIIGEENRTGFGGALC